MATAFANVPNVVNAIRLLSEARAAVLEVYPLSESNEWVRTPPPEICEALEKVRVAREHLENLCDYGCGGYKLEPDFAG